MGSWTSPWLCDCQMMWGVCQGAGCWVADKRALYHLKDYPIPVSAPGSATQLESRIACEHRRFYTSPHHSWIGRMLPLAWPRGTASATLTVLPSASFASTSCNPAETACEIRGLARTTDSGRDEKDFRNIRRSGMISLSGEESTGPQEMRGYEPYRILPAEFTETQASVQARSSRKN